MLTNKFLNFAIIFVFIFERLLELTVNQINKSFMVNRYFATVKFPLEALQMRLFHIMWFMGLIIETYFEGRVLTGSLFYLSIAILIWAQALRWYAIYTLGSFWSVDIYQVKEHPVIQNGPYKYLKHPNYLAVLTEFIVLPFLLGCPRTLVIGTVVNLFILKRRIYLEERALYKQAGPF